MRAEAEPGTSTRSSGNMLPVPTRPEPQLPAQPHLQIALRSYCESVLRHLRHGDIDTGAAPQTVGLTSCYAGEGVTTFSWQLALTAASNGRKVMLIDANFDAPDLHRVFETDLEPGLSEWLQQGRSVTRQVAVPNGKFMLVTAGAPPAENWEVYVEQMREFLHYAAENFDFVFVDLPPLSGPSDALPLTQLLDGVLLVVQAERVRRPVAKRCVTRLVRAGARPLGAVLNKRRQYIPRWLYRTL
jgi:capsular exopolysaccharide synthesis family protein